MPLNTKTFDQIVNEIFARLAAAGITDFNPGSVARTLVEAFAYGLDEVWYAISQVPDKFFIDKATGEWLDRRAWEWGLTRNPGTKAKGNVIVSRSTPAPFGQLIPKGTQFAYGDLVYQSTQDAELPQGATEAAVPVEAVAVGKAYNLPAGVELKQVGIAISLIETVRVGPEGVTGGVDPESDEELRQRILALRNQQGVGAVSDYEAWAMAIPGVKKARAISCPRGIGTVDLVIEPDGNVDFGELKSAVIAALEQQKPSGVDMRVLLPKERFINVLVKIAGAADFELVRGKIVDYLNVIPIGGIVRRNGLISAVLGVVGVEDCDLTIPTENVFLAPDEKAVPGNIEVVAW